MKSRFSTIDIAAVVKELTCFLGMRVMNVYDIDNKTYLIRLGKPDDKAVILIESGIRIHSTDYEWPKNAAPSGFSMKMRKHLKGRRLESIAQLGVDRIVDMQFGSGEAAYHVVLELYDRGNIVLTDFEYTILNILRPRADNSTDVKFAVRETYPIDSAREHTILTEEKVKELMLTGKPGDPLKKFLIPNTDYGPALIEHCLRDAGFPENIRIGTGFNIETDLQQLMMALQIAEEVLQHIYQRPCKGYIVQKSEKRPNAQPGEDAELMTYDEFNPWLFKQIEAKNFLEFELFNKAVDQFFSQIESQKLDSKALGQEKSALKKLDNIKKDHEKRLDELQKDQTVDKLKGQLIEMNLTLVDHGITIVRNALANQIAWPEIQSLVKEAQIQGDPVARAIKSLQLETNHMTMFLCDPYVDGDEIPTIKPQQVSVDLSLSAYANSRKYFEKKRQAAKKEQKTIDASQKALKSAERKTRETLKEVATAVSINKARKTYWFEKFLWFISSENYLVIGGRDQQQNEFIVKRYLKPGDLYVHADLHGASSCVIKNPSGEEVPPKTLNEAGTMAICHSAAWDAKVVTSAWWVYHHQVSKTAPSGEYLTTGSFMIRGKKNYLPPSYLVYGFGILFRLEDGSIFRHRGERKVRTVEEDAVSVTDSIATTESEVTIETEDSDDDNDVADTGETDSDNSEEKDSVLNSKEKDSISDSEDEGIEGHLNDANVNNAVHFDKDQSSDIKSDVEGNLDTEVKVETGRTDNLTTKMEVEKSESESEEEDLFPDTEIKIQHVKGDKYELHRVSSVEPVEIEEPKEIIEKKTARLSAKQRRELKKAKKGQAETPTEEVTEISFEKHEEKINTTRQESQNNENQKQNVPPKRGQKGKQKKIREKYKDQDEEERQLRMQILGSAGPPKESKKKGKNKQDVVKKSQQNNPKVKKAPVVPVIIDEMTALSIEAEVKPEFVKEDTKKELQEEGQESDEEKQDDSTQQSSDVAVLDSLTGLPVTEDELLFAVPVCAPYNSLTNFKYKIKLLPGNTKRGKAAKAILNVFSHEKSATTREKDLVKILKDVDMSRNIPGKVKLAAPNLHKKKGK